jgi:hypothetical protein
VATLHRLRGLAPFQGVSGEAGWRGHLAQLGTRDSRDFFK